MVAPPPSHPAASRAVVVTALGIAQTLSWASTYYVPAILAEPMAAELGLPRSRVFAAFSAALLITALLGPSVGRIIDRYGGRGVLAVSNLVIAGGLTVLAVANGPVMLFAGWGVLGIAMALGLYDAAFASLTALYGSDARSPITGITLFAGFASTVSWPVSALLNEAFGWRETCLVWAALNLVIALPLNRFLLPPIAPRPRQAETAAVKIGWTPRREMMLLAFFFAAGWFVAGAMAAHLPALLELAGASPLEAIAAAALVGPAQVAARLCEFALLRRVHPLVSARISLSLHLLAIAALALFGAPAAAAAYAILFGGGNGLLTITRGTLPLAIFGPFGYGERSGLLGAPARLTQAFAPFIFGFLMERFGIAAIGVSAVLFAAAFVALFFLRANPAERP